MGSWSGNGAAAAAVALVSCLCFSAASVGAIGANWGTQASHLLSPDSVVRMLKENGFQKVKLFDAEEGPMNALKKSGLEVMVGIPNELLYPIAASMKSAEKWVDRNVSHFLNDGVNIRYLVLAAFETLQLLITVSVLQLTHIDSDDWELVLRCCLSAYSGSDDLYLLLDFSLISDRGFTASLELWGNEAIFSWSLANNLSFYGSQTHTHTHKKKQLKLLD
jgi:hypothetical protein